jgi:hypothetical protein
MACGFGGVGWPDTLKILRFEKSVIFPVFCWQFTCPLLSQNVYANYRKLIRIMVFDFFHYIYDFDDVYLNNFHI